MSKFMEVLKAAWVERKNPDEGKRFRTELEFLPAALEVTETPVSPAPRMILLSVCVLILIAILWACFGQIDIIAVAQGKIIPSGNVKVVQPFERAVVKKLYVQDGMNVKQGQLLIELDATELVADQEKNRNALSESRLAQRRAQRILEALAAQAPSIASLPPLPGIPELTQAESNRLMLSEYQAFRTQLNAQDAELTHLQAQGATTRESLGKLEALYPLLEQRAADFKRLLAKQYVAQHQYLDQEQQRLETAKEIEVQRRRLTETQTLIARQRQQKAATLADFTRQTREKLSQAELQLAQQQQDDRKLDSRRTLLELRAPVDGTVQQLAVHTEGGVVTEAQPLLVVVPAHDGLAIDAFVQNKDIGFVRAGQIAEIKVDAFPYTRYGLVDGTVLNVSSDAIQDEKQGLIYHAKVKMKKDWMNIDGKQLRLSPGMSVAVEVKTGKRRVIEYFLSPVMQYQHEGVRER